jgi:hypothetical protein
MGKMTLFAALLGLVALAISVAAFRARYDERLIHTYFDIEGYRFIDRHSSFSASGRVSYTLFNIEATKLTALSTITEEKCSPWVAQLPNESILYEAAPDALPTEDVGKHVESGIDIHCYQLSDESEKGLPTIGTYFEKSTGRATLIFPAQLF